MADQDDELGFGIPIAPADVVPGSVRHVDYGPTAAPSALFTPTTPDLPAPKEFPESFPTPGLQTLSYSPHGAGSVAGNLAPPTLEVPAQPGAPPAAPDVSLGVRMTGPPADPGEDRVTRSKPADLVQGVRDILTPGAYLSEFGKERAAQAQYQDASMKEQEIALKQLKDRDRLYAEVQSRFAEYKKGLAEKRPDPPKLSEIPKAPDVRVRPWLDPEGKNAITVIAQGLQMLALGISGVKLNAPNTALRQFRQLAEDWRRDEIDSANSKMNEFKATVTQIEGNNRTALDTYEILDRQYTNNLVAKEAVAAAAMKELGLHDQATIAAMMPYEKQKEAAQSQMRSSAAILEQMTRLEAIAEKYKKAAVKPSTSLGQAEGRIASLTARIAQTQDPEEKKDLQIQLMTEQATRTMMLKDQTQLASSKAGIQIGSKLIGSLNKSDEMIDFFASRITQMIPLYQAMYESGLLPDDNSWMSQKLAAGKRALRSNWTQAASDAETTLGQLYTQVSIGEAKTFANDQMRALGAFGEVHQFHVPWTAFLKQAEGWLEMLRQKRETNSRMRSMIYDRVGEGLEGFTGRGEGDATEGGEGD